MIQSFRTPLAVLVRAELYLFAYSCTACFKPLQPCRLILPVCMLPARQLDPSSCTSLLHVCVYLQNNIQPHKLDANARSILYNCMRSCCTQLTQQANEAGQPPMQYQLHGSTQPVLVRYMEMALFMAQKHYVDAGRSPALLQTAWQHCTAAAKSTVPLPRTRCVSKRPSPMATAIQQSVLHSLGSCVPYFCWQA